MSRATLRRLHLGRVVASLAVTVGLAVLPAATPVPTSAAALSATSVTGSGPGPTAPAAAAAGGAGDPSALPVEGVPSYRLYRNPDGSSVRFDPCRPLRVRINAPSRGAEADAREALRRLVAVTGHQVVIEGRTDFVPTRAARTLPGVELVIAWVPPAGRPGGSDILADGQLGTGGWTTEGVRYDGSVVWRATGAFAVLDGTREDLEPGFGPGLTRGALLLHEIAHALGVDHVDDETQLMHPVLQHRAEPVALGAGDLEALRQVGARAGCLPG